LQSHRRSGLLGCSRTGRLGLAGSIRIGPRSGKIGLDGCQKSFYLSAHLKSPLLRPVVAGGSHKPRGFHVDGSASGANAVEARSCGPRSADRRHGGPCGALRVHFSSAAGGGLLDCPRAASAKSQASSLREKPWGPFGPLQATGRHAHQPAYPSLPEKYSVLCPPGTRPFRGPFFAPGGSAGIARRACRRKGRRLALLGDFRMHPAVQQGH